MVVFHVKRADGDAFLYETTCATTTEALLADLVWVWNARVRLQRLVSCARGLLSTQQHGGSEEETAASLLRVVEDAEAYLGPAPASAPEEGGGGGGGKAPQHAMARAPLQAKLDHFQAAVTLAYPTSPAPMAADATTGNGEQEALLSSTLRHLALADNDDDATTTHQTPDDPLFLDPRTAQVWAMGKPFLLSQTIGDRLGGSRNEKTKLVVKLSGPGQGAPAREPAVREEERQAMMHHYFKRQEELKKLAEADNDDYLHAAWADGKHLQRHLRGVGAVKAPGLH